MGHLSGYRQCTGHDRQSGIVLVESAWALPHGRHGLLVGTRGLHLAVQSLRRGECETALVGGVQVGLARSHYDVLARLRAISPRGRCRTFDRTADGYVPGEGVGLVLLKPLRQALADGDQVQAVILGTAVNHGGQAAGLTVPNAEAQAEVIRAALDDAGVSAETIDYLEAHGTGTALGDPIEVEGLTRAFATQTDRRQFCAIGTVKSNVGHLEAAAGIAGVIRVLLALKARQVPPTLHVEEANPAIRFEQSPCYVNDQLTPWPAKEHPRRAAISAFGFGGTNAHVIVEEPPLRNSGNSQVERAAHVLSVSAHSAIARSQLAERLADHLEQHPTERLGDICYTANTGRWQADFRLSIPCETCEGLVARLRAVAHGRPEGADWVSETSPSARPQVALLFTGQGSQYRGMARQLYATQPTFRRALDQCGELLRPHLDIELDALLFGTAADRIDQTCYAQPALVAVEYALYAMWRDWGLEPAAVMGHSLGEYTAACVAGVLTLSETLALVARRARLMQALPPGGSMAAVFAERELIEDRLTSFAGRLSVAAINGPQHVVVSGEEAALAELLDRLVTEQIASQRLSVSHAFHSPLVEPMLDALRAAAAEANQRAPTIDLVSNLTGQLFAADHDPTPDYWCRHARQPVQFAAGLSTLLATGVDACLELGPHPVLANLGRRLDRRGILWLRSLERGQDDWRVVAESIARLDLAGVRIDWEAFDRGYNRHKIALPTYPFQRERHSIHRQQVEHSQRESHRKQPAHANVDRSVERWFYELDWRPAPCTTAEPRSGGPWLVLHRADGQADALLATLRAGGNRVIEIVPGQQYTDLLDDRGEIRPGEIDDYVRLADSLHESGVQVTDIAHLWSLETGARTSIDESAIDDCLQRGLAGPTFLLRTLLQQTAAKLRLWVVTRNTQAVGDHVETIDPLGAAPWTLARIVPEEFAGVETRAVDLSAEDDLAERFCEELGTKDRLRQWPIETAAAGHLDCRGSTTRHFRTGNSHPAPWGVSHRRWFRRRRHGIGRLVGRAGTASIDSAVAR